MLAQASVELIARQKHPSTAMYTHQTDVCPQPHHLPAIRAAGMRLAQYYVISHLHGRIPLQAVQNLFLFVAFCE